MIVKHEWQMQPIIDLINFHLQSFRSKGYEISTELKEALDNAKEALNNGNNSFDYKGDEQALLNIIIKEAKSKGIGGRMKQIKPQNYMKAAATVYYDNTGEWPEGVYLVDHSSIR